MERKFSTYKEFWPYYLQEHSLPKTRALHYAGTAAGLLTAAFTVASGHPALLPLALIPSYGAAWVAHFKIEKNRPATFIHPLWSFVSDFRMAGLWCGGRLEKEYQRYNIPYRPQ